ncbi:MAG TPA: helix-turn-helix transcriptional regulator [Thermoleophilaceae bacterium]
MTVLAPPRRRTSTEAARVALFREATALIEADLARPITLDELAEGVNASPRALRRAFVEIAGTTFSAYVREVRMARAARLLTGSARSVHEIAASVGYGQPSQFTKAFRRSFGVTPTAYRLSGPD